MAMDAAALGNLTNAIGTIDTGEPDTLSENICLNDIVSLSSNGVRMQEPGNAGEILTRIELDVAYCSEKLLNLDILLMRVSARENECESLATGYNDISEDSFQTGIEFDLLSGILDSELRELNNCMASLQTEIANAHQKNSSCEHFREAFIEIEDKLRDSEETLMQSQNQLGEMKMQFDKFRRTLSTFSGQEICDNKDAASENGQFSQTDTKLKMQTAEQKRHILRMLEKSLARELDLEKKLCDSRNSEDKLHLAEQELFWMEEETEVVFGRLFEAENAADLLMGISKELMGRLQILQFNLNGSVRRESDMMSKMRSLEEKLNESESDLQKAQASIREREQEKVLSSELRELESVVDDLKGNIAKEESRADSFAAKCTELTQSNMELSEKLDSLRNNSSENVSSLEKKLNESSIQLEHANASVEASQEQKHMLYSAIDDMENLISDLKSRVSKAESRAEKAEAKCTLLSETNLDMNEELAFLRNKMECLEISMNQADDEKMVTAKDIKIRTTAIADLVLRIAMERERLEKQISSLLQENKVLAAKLDKDPTLTMKHISEDDPSTFAKVSEEAVAESLASTFQMNKLSKEATIFEGEVETAVLSTENVIGGVSSVETVRSIDAWQLTWKHYLVPIIILLFSMFAIYLYQMETCPF